MCDLSCKTKIIINGDNVSALIETLCKQIEWARTADIDLPHGDQIVALLNKMEDDAGKAQRIFLQDVGFTGPWPKALGG